MADQSTEHEIDLAYLAYLAQYQPQTFAKWMHLIRMHPRITDRPCRCDAPRLLPAGMTEHPHQRGRSPMPDQLTETLDFLSVRVDAARTTPEAFDLDELLGEAGRALAALGVVLKLAAEWDQSATDLDEMAVRAAERGAADFRVEEMVTRAQAHRDCAQKLRSAISGELLGTKDSDDGNPRCKNCHVPVRRCGCTWPHPGCDRTGGWVHVDTGHGCAGARGTCAEPESTKGGGAGG